MNGSIHFYDYHPPVADIKAEVLGGLSKRPKQIPPKYFYDQRGSQLFDAITELPEYYPTRTELNILEANGEQIAEFLGDDCLLMELGSGSSRKIRVLLDALRPAAYVPLDISRDHLLSSAKALAKDYPHLDVHAACTDYSTEFELPELPGQLRRAAFFPGSSIGNFEPAEACALMRRVGAHLGQDGRLLIGVDLKKDNAILHAAYNDAQRLTAAFNLNLLQRINRELGGDFDLERFEHRAFFNEQAGRVEMHLLSRGPQQVMVAGSPIAFAAGESLHTENSYKYDIAEFQALAASSGFVAERVWTDDQQLFSVHCLRWAPRLN
ncbi:MAG: L-histidine N(alpha)-methyltransferase [Thiogranum sp.]|jgi:dimethylhistidine N-methyltransferase|nr:L-histidine N(alpha)-methyltransferase [Thiogranum sp.]